MSPPTKRISFDLDVPATMQSNTEMRSRQMPSDKPSTGHCPSSEIRLTRLVPIPLLRSKSSVNFVRKLAMVPVVDSTRVGCSAVSHKRWYRPMTDDAAHAAVANSICRGMRRGAGTTPMPLALEKAQRNSGGHCFSAGRRFRLHVLSGTH